MKQEKPPKFLVKLLNIVRSKQHAKIIAWDLEEKGIRILNEQKLQSHILPRYFRHNRISSFVRQLNMYDFHKINSHNGNSIFFHNQFNPKDKQSINHIKRKSATMDKEGQTSSKNSQIQNKPLQKIYVAQKFMNKIKPRESFQLLFPKSSLNSFNSMNGNKKQLTPEQVLEEILNQLHSLAILSPNTIKDKINQLKKIKKFRKFLKRGSFLSRLYQKLGIEMDEDDKLSEFSIEEQLLFQTNTRKTVTLQSFKMFDSGTINLRDTLGMFLS